MIARLIWLCALSSLCNGFLFGDFDFFGNNQLPNGMEEINMILYDRSVDGEVMYYNYTLNRSQELIQHVDLQKPFVLYIHGFEEHPSNESVQTIIAAYLQRKSENIVILDWSALASDSYIVVAQRVKDIAKLTAKALQNLVALGVETDTLHIIGHSLGAQVAGFMGRHLNFTLPRVTGLDPANPLFYQFGSDHIDETSGLFVDVVHTDGGLYGAFVKTGTVDFYPNGGTRPQPGCQLFGVPLTPRSLCSHWRSWRFYAESVVRNTAFPAVECESYRAFQLGECHQNRIVYFGYSVPKNISGNYFFKTSSESPYGRGLRGISNK